MGDDGDTAAAIGTKGLRDVEGADGGVLHSVISEDDGFVCTENEGFRVSGEWSDVGDVLLDCWREGKTLVDLSLLTNIPKSVTMTITSDKKTLTKSLVGSETVLNKRS